MSRSFVTKAVLALACLVVPAISAPTFIVSSTALAQQPAQKVQLRPIPNISEPDVEHFIKFMTALGAEQQKWASSPASAAAQAALADVKTRFGMNSHARQEQWLRWMFLNAQFDAQTNAFRDPVAIWKHTIERTKTQANMTEDQRRGIISQIELAIENFQGPTASEKALFAKYGQQFVASILAGNAQLKR
jgi:hypothetical protein